jgi:hypothetical protein
MDTQLKNTKPNGYIPNDREYFTRWIEGFEELMEERDRRYGERFDAQDRAVSAAFQAQKELNRIVAESSEKAIIKAENAQRDYNQRSNEFRGALDDQAKVMSRDMLSRKEYESSRCALDDKINALGGKYDEKIDDIKDNIQGIRESLSKTGGKEEKTTEVRAQQQWSVSTVGAWVVGGCGLVIGIISLITK